jgi:hypothetical protein
VICPGRHLVTKFDRPFESEYKAVKDELQAELTSADFSGLARGGDRPPQTGIVVPKETAGVGFEPTRPFRA